MEENKANNKRKIVICMLILVIIAAICVGGYAIGVKKEKNYENEKTNETNSENNNIIEENNINNVEQEDQNEYDEDEEVDEENLDPNEIREKQTVNAIGYKIVLYTDNTIKLYPNKEELENVSPVEYEETTDFPKAYDIKKSKNVESMYQANNGTGVDPITFFLMEDGTVQYIKPLETLILKPNKNIIRFEISDTVENLNNIVEIKENENGVLIAVDQDNREVKFWNQ